MGLYFERYGKGKPVLFIHGAGGSTLAWHYQKEDLRRTLEVVLIDLPGHGSSPGQAPDAIEAHGEAVAAAIREMGIEGCIIAGHSMGGAIAMSLALSRPEVLSGIILVGTGARLKVLPAILRNIGHAKEATVRSIVDFAFSSSASPELKEAGFSEMMKCDSETIFRDFTACDRFDMLAGVKAVRVPTLIVCGSDDRLTPPAYSQYLHGQIAGSSLELIDGAGHMVMLEKPGEVNRTIARFALEGV